MPLYVWHVDLLWCIIDTRIVFQLSQAQQRQRAFADALIPADDQNAFSGYPWFDSWYCEFVAHKFVPVWWPQHFVQTCHCSRVYKNAYVKFDYNRNEFLFRIAFRYLLAELFSAYANKIINRNNKRSPMPCYLSYSTYNEGQQYPTQSYEQKQYKELPTTTIADLILSRPVWPGRRGGLVQAASGHHNK